MKRLFLFFFISVFSFSQEEKRLALVIGNSNYDKGELKNPVSDANLIAQTLDSLDFDVILATNLEDQRSFLNTIREFGNRRPEYDVGFVYYAGHGVQIAGENYLLPTKEIYESKNDIEDYAVNVVKIMKYLTEMTNQVNILILDACRDNPFEQNWNATRSLKGEGLAKMPPPTGSLIAFSTDAGNTAADGDGENSIYCKSLVKNMLLENTTLDQVFRNVRTDVLKASNNMQRPIESSQLTGDAFYLIKSNYEEEFAHIKELMINPRFNYENIIELTREILSVEKTNKRAFLYLGQVYYENEKFDKSLESYNAALKIDSVYVDALTDRGILFSDMAQEFYEQSLINKMDSYYELSMDDFNLAINIDSLNPKAYNSRGNLYYFKLDDYENGLKDYNKAIKLDSTYHQAYINRGSVYNELDSIDRSFSDYKKLINWNDKGIINLSNKDQAYIYRNRGNLYNWNTDYELAVKDYEKTISLNPDWDLPHRILVNLYDYINDDENKLIHLKKYISLQPKTITGLFNVADIYRLTKDYKSELEVYDQMELLFDNVDVRMKKLTAFNRSKRFNEIIDLSKKMLDEDLNFQQKTFTLYFQAIAYKNIDLLDKAEESYLKLIEIEPTIENYRFLGRYYYELEQFNKAIETYNLGIEIDGSNKANKDYKFIIDYRAEAYTESNQPKKAIDDWLELIDIDIESSHVYLNEIANTYSYNLGDYDKGIEYFNKSIEANSDYLYSYINKARIYDLYLSDYPKAIEIFHKALEISLKNENLETSADLYNYIGLTYKSMDDFEKAIEYFTKAIEISPDNIDFLFNRAFSYGSNNYNKQLIDYLKLLTLPEGNTYRINNNIAQIYRNYIKDYDKAIEYYSNALVLAPEDPGGVTYNNLAQVYNDILKNSDEAIKVYERGIEIDSLNANHYFKRSEIYLNIDDFSNSLNDINNAIRITLSKVDYDKELLAEMYEIRANVYKYSNKPKKAINDWVKTYESDSSYQAYANYKIGEIYLNDIRDFESAILNLSKSLDLKYWKPEYVLYERSVAYTNQKKYSLALTDINKAIELDPDNLNFNFTKLNIYLLINDFEKAIIEANKTIKFDRKDPQGFYALAYIMNVNKKYYKSLNYVSIAIEKLLANENYYISDLNGLDSVFLTDLYQFRANLYSEIGVLNLSCDDYNSALNLISKEKNEILYHQLVKLTSDNCNYKLN
jgi:tetratricopeptide (TPR) repeat protein